TLGADDQDPYVNTACFDAHDDVGGDGGTFSDVCDDASTDIVHPGFTVQKDVDVDSAHIGDLLTYTITVTNTGDNELTVDGFTDANCENFSPAVPASFTLAPSGD